jgi:hypothetical protein
VSCQCLIADFTADGTKRRKDYQFPVKGTEKKKQLTTLMLDNLIATFTEDEPADVVEYLMTLKTASLTPNQWNIAGPFAAEGDAALDKDFGPGEGRGLGREVRRRDVADGAGGPTGSVDLAA